MFIPNIKWFKMRPFIHVPIRPMITRSGVLMAKAVQQMAAPANVTDVPRLTPVYLLIIFARISSPPVEALMLKRILCEALKISTKQSRSNHGLATMPSLARCWANIDSDIGKTFPRKSIIGPSISAV